jgi:hypothetical protein
MEFYVFFDDIFPCGIPPQNVVEDITTWMFGEHQGYGEGQVEIGVCGKVFTPKPLMVDVVIDIVGCPSAAQKQIIEQYIRELFARICPSMPFRIKQVELIIATVIGAEIDSSVRFEPPEGVTWAREDVWVTACGDLEPECDVMPCLNTITFLGPDPRGTPC